MDYQTVTNIIFNVIGGLGIFLLGMTNLSNGLQTVAGDRLRWLIGKVTNNRFMAASIGTLVTAIIQSSSITTVMVVGFVNAGLMTLVQAIGVIMGANIGTTLTAWILVIKIGKYGLPLLGIAALISIFAKKEKTKYIATALMGLGMVFFGLQLMKNGFKPIRSIPEFTIWFQAFSADTYFGVIKCILTGALLTMIVQSSSATMGITIGLATTGIIPFETAAALVLGENIGTTITAFLASFGAKTNAKRAAYAHVVFNLAGVSIIFILFYVYLNFIKTILGVDPNTMVMKEGTAVYPHIASSIATVHSVFNILNTFIFIWFLKPLARLLEKLIPGELESESTHLLHLDPRMIESPTIFIEQSKKEIDNMNSQTEEMFYKLEQVFEKDYKKSDKDVRFIFQKEEDMDIIQKELSDYLVKAMAEEGAKSLTKEAKNLLSCSDEYESVSDYITNITKLKLKLDNNDLKLSNEKKEDLMKLHKKILNYYKFITNNNLENKIEFYKESIRINKETTDFFKDMRSKHLNDVVGKTVDPLMITAYTDMLNFYRRIKDHIFHISEVLSGEI